MNALEKKDIPIYGDGSQIRDWLHVDDHVTALFEVSNNGIIGQTYNIGSSNEKKNIEMRQICEILDQLKPNASPHEDLIKFVKIDQDMIKDMQLIQKIQKQLSWKPLINFNDGLTETIKWYLEKLGKIY